MTDSSFLCLSCGKFVEVPAATHEQYDGPFGERHACPECGKAGTVGCESFDDGEGGSLFAFTLEPVEEKEPT